jgi:hypothetical protein
MTLAWHEGQNILDAFRPEPELYFEVIEAFYKIKTFSLVIIKSPVTYNLWSTFDKKGQAMLGKIINLKLESL